MAGVFGKVFRGKNAADLDSFHFGNIAEDRAGGNGLPAVIADTVRRFLNAFSRGYGGNEEQYLLIADHGLDIVPQNDLIVDPEFGRDDGDVLSRAHSVDRRGKLLRQKRADHAGSLDAEDRVDRRSVKRPRELLRGFPRRFEAVFDLAQVDVAADVRMVGGEMPGDNAETDPAVSARLNFLYRKIHNSVLSRLSRVFPFGETFRDGAAL